MSFVSKYLKHTENYESPSSFWKWSAYVTIAAVLRDNAYRAFGDMKVYPNIYVLTLAPSGIYRKGFPVNLCKQLLTALSVTKIVSGRTSIQALIDELSHAEADPRTGKIIQKGAAIFLAPELAAGLVADQASISILTDIYDLKTDYTTHLKGSGKKKVEKVVFSMYAASNEALLREVYDIRAMQGGLLARTFLVVPDEFRPSNSLLGTNHRKEEFNALLMALAEIYKNVKGEFQFTDSAREEYEGWYKDFRMSYEKKSDKAGVVGRIHMSILKLAMILAANDLTLLIDKCHIEESIHLAMSLVPNYNHLIVGTGKSELSEAGALLTQELMKADGNKISRKEFLRKNWSTVDSDQLDKITATLAGADLVQTLTFGNEVYFVMTQKYKDMIKGGGA